jgi:hypothetical protein
MARTILTVGLFPSDFGERDPPVGGVYVSTLVDVPHRLAVPQEDDPTGTKVRIGLGDCDRRKWKKATAGNASTWEFARHEHVVIVIEYFSK